MNERRSWWWWIPLLLVLGPLGSIAAQTRLTLSERAYLPAETGFAYSLALADLDGDGDPDLVVGAFNRATVFANQGDGRFVFEAELRDSSRLMRVADIAIGDLDGDGRPDIALADGGWAPDLYGVSQVFSRGGSGGYMARSVILVAHTNGIAMADFDRDGDLDIVTANGHPEVMKGGTHPERNFVFLNDGRGGLTLVSLPPAPDDVSMCVACGDVDGDGDVDVLFGNAGQDQLLLSTGTGTFVDGTSARLPAERFFETGLAFGDIDRDGDLDLARASQWGLAIYSNDGSGRFTNESATRLPSLDARSTSLRFGDLDGDGDTDLVYLDDAANGGSPGMYVLANDGMGRFTRWTLQPDPLVGGTPSALVLVDCDSDGDLDIAVANRAWTRSQLLLNDARGGFVDATITRIPRDHTRSVWAAGDFDGDGDEDIATGGDGDRPAATWLNDGTGQFQSILPNPVASLPYFVRLMESDDIDVDGDVDLVVLTNASTGSAGWMHVVRNAGAARFLVATSITTPPGARVLRVIDLDADGDRDLVAAFADRIVVYRNNRDGHFYPVLWLPFAAPVALPPGVAAGDIDGDGDDDLVMNRGDLRWHANDGAIGYGAGIVIDASNDAGDLELVDVDGDCDPDLVVAAEYGADRLFENLGGGRFVDATSRRFPPPASTPGRAVTPRDFDGDGDLDLVFASGRFLENDGTGRFVDRSAAWLPASGTRGFDNPIAFDIDDDGDVDLGVTPRVFIGALGHFHVNLLRQTELPRLARVGREFAIDIHGGPGDVAIPLVALGEAWLPLPPFGTLRLDPALIHALPEVTLPASGRVEVLHRMPNDPALIGWRLSFQTFLLRPAQLDASRFTNLAHDTISGG
ncbi:MAG: VCBS repeat-containing protein [Planctomycetes bacterium]|nr:VCBS repeat-containing protein [Planctomycetota bacterium]